MAWKPGFVWHAHNPKDAKRFSVILHQRWYFQHTGTWVYEKTFFAANIVWDFILYLKRLLNVVYLSLYTFYRRVFTSNLVYLEFYITTEHTFSKKQSQIQEYIFFKEKKWIWLQCIASTQWVLSMDNTHWVPLGFLHKKCNKIKEATWNGHLICYCYEKWA